MRRKRLVLICSFLFHIKTWAKTDCPSLITGIQFHNAKVEARMQGELNRQNLQSLVDLMLENGSFDMRVSPQGFVAAADVGSHKGNYGRFFWLRDMARVYVGKSDFKKLLEEVQHAHSSPKVEGTLKQARTEAREQALGLVKVLSTTKWTAQALANIADPTWHEDPKTGFKNVIWVRLLLAPFNEERATTAAEIEEQADWGHKQNDALALLAHAVLDALNNGDLTPTDLPPVARANLMLLPAYFSRLEYWRMPDAGAWEELLAVHTSSVALVTSFLERFQKGWNEPTPLGTRTGEEQFFDELRETNGDLLEKTVADPKTLALAEDSLLTQNLQRDIRAAYDVLNQNFFADRPTEASVGDKNGLRGEDSAMLHGLWYPLQRQTRAAIDRWVGGLEILRRQSGYTRYVDDWFLHGAAAAEHAEALGIADRLVLYGPDGKTDVGVRPRLRELEQEYAAHARDKVMTKIDQIVGPGLEAQWTLPDSILAQHYADRFARDREPADRELAIKHLQRAAGELTGEGEVTIEGESVVPLRMPEAYIPVRVLDDHGRTVTRFFVSPNSPLNWSTAEFQSALLKVYKILD